MIECEGSSRQSSVVAPRQWRSSTARLSNDYSLQLTAKKINQAIMRRVR